jgi:hypothetical protein
MHDDLKECIATAKLARDRLLAKELTVKEANAVTGANHIIVTAHALDLRERIFVAENQQAPTLEGAGRLPVASPIETQIAAPH